MKAFLLVGIFLLISLKGISQFVPNTGQGFHFAPLYNPAFTGIEGYQDLKLGYRYQWTGLGGEAPKFINLSFNFRVKEPLDLTLNAIRTSMAKSQNKDIPKIKRVIHGLGVNVFNEKEYAINRVGGGVNYSFHYPVSKELKVALGLNATFHSTKIDPNKIYFGKDVDPNKDPVYQELLRQPTYSSLNVRAGILVYAPRYYFGFSYLPLVYTALNDTLKTIAQPQYYRGVIQAGYSLPVSASMDIKPSILAIWQMDDTFIIDYNIKVYIEQKIWFGLTYRDIKSLVGIIGFNLNERLGASYSYELSANKMRQFSDGSHDLVLSVRLNNFKRQRQQTW